MKFRQMTRIAVLTILATATVSAAEDASKFSFTKIDLDLLTQADYLDKKFEREGLVYHDAGVNSYVTQVGMSMLPAGSAPERVTWGFKVLRDPMPNAVALPNGSIYVNSGLISLLENEDQLAGVLAHEITHVTDRHAYLFYRSYRKKAAIASVAEYVAQMAPGGSSWGAVVKLCAAMVPAIMEASITGYSRELEQNADTYSFNKLVEGNYDPKELPNVFRLLERKDEIGLTKMYYNDHPKLEERVKHMTSLLESKNLQPVPADLLAERKTKYEGITETVDREDINLAIQSHKPRTALARANKLLAMHPNSVENMYCVGEAYRSLGPWTAQPSEKEMGGSGQKEIKNLQKKFTADEEERELLTKDDGQAAWKENQRLSEEVYQKAIASDPQYAATYRGLGQLYDKQHKDKEAVAAFQKYLELQPTAFDKPRIQQRIDTLSRSQSQ
jgi:predicted Zn-dependent protease